MFVISQRGFNEQDLYVLQQIGKLLQLLYLGYYNCQNL